MKLKVTLLHTLYKVWYNVCVWRSYASNAVNNLFPVKMLKVFSVLNAVILLMLENGRLELKTLIGRVVDIKIPKDIFMYTNQNTQILGLVGT